MRKGYQEAQDVITIRDLYPSLDEAERQEAEANLDRYLALALRIYERVMADAANHAEVRALTVSRPEVGSEAKGRIPPETEQPLSTT